MEVQAFYQSKNFFAEMSHFFAFTIRRKFSNLIFIFFNELISGRTVNNYFINKTVFTVL